VKTLALRERLVVDRGVWDGGTGLVEGGKIKVIEREAPATDARETLELPESFLVPGFVELQINGAFGVDRDRTRTPPEALREAAVARRLRAATGRLVERA